MNTIRKIYNNKVSRIIFFIILDVLVLFLTSLLTLSLRFDFGTVPELFLTNTLKLFVVDSIILVLIFALCGLYESMWNYASVRELLFVAFACFLFEVINFSYTKIFGIELFNSFYLIRLILLIFFIGFERFFYRILRVVKKSLSYNNRNKNTMIIGAGEAGRILIDEIYGNDKVFDTKVVCIIDDNKGKIGSKIRGIPVVGNSKTISENCEKYHIENIIIAIPSASKDTIHKIVVECQKTKCEIKILPSIYKSMDTTNMKNVRPLYYEDFLGRDQIVVDTKEIENTIKSKTVMVTGGGGSIGSELCRQIAKCNPKELIIFDIYENNAYDIQQELVRNYPELKLHVIIGSVRDYDRLENVFIKYHPEVVFHAAAHKHVPLMEVSPNEAIKNNCLGTLNCAKLADKYKTKKFVLISTDKCLLFNVNKILKPLKSLLNTGYEQKLILV